MSINLDLFYFINNNLQNPVLDWSMPAVTNLGGFVALFFICIIVIIIAGLFDYTQVKKIAIICLLSLLIADGIALVLKYAVAEPRPFVALDNVRLLISESDMNSFPSGHATSTFSVIAVLLFKLKNNYIKVILAIFAILIAFSRIYVGVHYPHDVVCGTVLGIAVAYAVCYFNL